MAEIFPQDIETAVLNRLKDNTTGINAYIQTINTARSQETPEILDRNITTERTDANPEVIIDYESSSINDYFGGDINYLRKTCNLTVTAVITSSKLEDLKKWISNYIEAITKSLNQYSTGNITSINAIEDIIDDLYKDETETTKIGGVRFEILINGGAE